MKQYPEQAAVLSLEELLDGKDSVTFDHCSIFIDNVFWAIVGGVFCGIGGYVVGGTVGAVAGGAVSGGAGVGAGYVAGGVAGGITAGYECGKAIAKGLSRDGLQCVAHLFHKFRQ